MAKGISRLRKLQLAAEPDCHYCDAPATTVDHIIPKSSGGRDVHWNLVSACQPCNAGKGPKWPDCSCGRCQAAEAEFILSPAIEQVAAQRQRRSGPMRKQVGSRAYKRAVARGYLPEVEPPGELWIGQQVVRLHDAS